MEPLVLTARGCLLEAMDPNPKFTFGMSKLGIAFRHFLGTHGLWRVSPGPRTNVSALGFGDGPMPADLHRAHGHDSIRGLGSGRAVHSFGVS